MQSGRASPSAHSRRSHSSQSIQVDPISGGTSLARRRRSEAHFLHRITRLPSPIAPGSALRSYLQSADVACFADTECATLHDGVGPKNQERLGSY